MNALAGRCCRRLALPSAAAAAGWRRPPSPLGRCLAAPWRGPPPPPPGRCHAAHLGGIAGLPPLEQLLRGRARMTGAAQAAWAQVLRPGDTAVDATAGNGGDAAFLAARVGPSGRVFAFDVQPAALEATRGRLAAAAASAPCAPLTAVLGCHSRLLDHVGRGAAALVVFNLGFLPVRNAPGQAASATQPATTVLAVEAALQARAGAAAATAAAPRSRHRRRSRRRSPLFVPRPAADAPAR